MTRCVLYARVSKEKGPQTPENQLRKLREFATSQGWDVTHEYVGRLSGAKADRLEFLEIEQRREAGAVERPKLRSIGRARTCPRNGSCHCVAMLGARYR